MKPSHGPGGPTTALRVRQEVSHAAPAFPRGFARAARPHLPKSHWDRLTIALIVGIALISLATVRDYAISNDELVQQRYGELIIAYYASGFADKSLFAFDNLYLYGGLFDIMATLAARVLPFDLFHLRHLLSAAIGIAGIAATALTARDIGGPRAGFLAGALLALCGVWYGGMFNHTKDIPFGAAMIGAMLFLLRAARELPQPRLFNVIGLGLLLGAALGLRAMGLLLIGFAGLAVLSRLSQQEDRSFGAQITFLRASVVRLLPAFVLGYAIMVAAWPWSALHPLNPVRAILSFAHFHHEIRTLLAGDVFTMDQVPRSYVPIYLAIKLPLILWTGALIAVAQAIWRPNRVSPSPASSAPSQDVLLIAFAVAFPVLCHVVGHGPAFSGMRHFLFVTPFFAVLAGIGIHSLLRDLAAHGRLLSATVVGIVAADLALTASVLYRLHPHQYLYYNELVGGFAGAARRYETDYWVNIMPEAVRLLENHLAREGVGGRTYTVGVCGERLSFEHEAPPNLRFSAGWLEADFFIAPAHMNCDRVIKGRIIARIERLGATVGVVQDLRGLGPDERGFHRDHRTLPQ